MQQMELIILFHYLQASVMIHIIMYVMNIVKCLISVMIFDIDKYSIKHEDDKIFDHTHII